MKSPSFSSIAASRATSIATGVILSILWVCFCIVHWQKYRSTGNVEFLFLLVADTMGVAFFILRSDPVSVSARPTDWIIAVAATCSGFFFRPSDYGILPVARYLIIPGSLMLILGLASLNRSFAIVPAKRVLKTDRMYRVVRHPLYASYCLIFLGYVLSNTSLNNLLAFSIVAILLVVRISREEAHLMKDDAYRAYAGRTKYRMLPLIY